MDRNKMTIPQLHKMKARGQRITMLTCYDASFARLLDGTIDILLVGDSLGMVIQGEPNTIPVTIDEMIYHTRCVARGTKRAHVVADMPFMSYQADAADAVRNAGRLLKEGRAEAVKVEGGAELAPTVAAMVQAGIPVMGHIGMRPQTIHQMGGYKIQGRSAAHGTQLRQDALALEAAGAYALVLEGVTMEWSAEITAAVQIPTIGICAGPHCDGQVLVLYDLLGMDPSFTPRFIKRYADLATTIRTAAQTYVEEVRAGTFPTEAHGFHREGTTPQGTDATSAPLALTGSTTAAHPKR